MKVMNESSIKVYNKKQQKILKQMNENSKKWHDTDNRFEKDRLHQANVELAEKLGGTILYDSYTGTWRGSAAHIDTEAWEPCGETCRNNCATCEHNADELFGDADYCKDCHRYSKWESSIHKYCERCGRPRTPEARAMLEKRLRGLEK